MCAWPRYPGRGRGSEDFDRPYDDHGRRYDAGDRGYSTHRRGYDDREPGYDNRERSYEHRYDGYGARGRPYDDYAREYSAYDRGYDDRDRYYEARRPGYDYDDRQGRYHYRDQDYDYRRSRDSERRDGYSRDAYSSRDDRSVRSRSSWHHSADSSRPDYRHDRAPERHVDREPRLESGPKVKPEREMASSTMSGSTSSYYTNSHRDNRPHDNRDYSPQRGSTSRGSYADSSERVTYRSRYERDTRDGQNDDRAATSGTSDHRSRRPQESSDKTEWYKQERYLGQGSRRSGADTSEHDDKHGRDRPRRLQSDDEAEQENSATILVRNLSTTISAEEIESAISDICIQNGSSAPNTVSVRSSQAGYGGTALQDSTSTHGLGAAVERFAVVTFPSPANAARFMECVKSRKLALNGVEFYVEYDTLEVNAAKPAGDNAAPYSELRQLEATMKRRAYTCDWICPGCRFVNFARRTACLTCDTEKPSEDQLQSHNLLVDTASTAQAQPIHTNVTDVSPWVVLKGIPLEADPAQLVLLVCGSVPEGAAHLQRCVYVIDPQPQSRRGFLFCQFAAASTVNSFQEALGQKLSELLSFKDVYLRLDAVRFREKQVADELLKNVRMNTLKVHYEFDPETFAASALSEEPPARKAGNREYRSCKVRTTNVSALQQASNAHAAPPGAKQYLSAWLGKSIIVPDGKPDTTKLTYDPKSDLFYDPRLSMYYDAASGYYVSVGGEYYAWDESSSSLLLTAQSGSSSASNDMKDTNDGGQDSFHGHVAGLLESAMKAAQMTNQTTQQTTQKASEKASNAVTGADSKAQADTTATKAAPFTASSMPTDISRTFDLGLLSDDECDMEVDSSTKAAGLKAGGMDEAGTTTHQPPEVRPLIVCLVCLRMFTDQTQLDLHERRSRYHRAMLECAPPAA
ncbi:asparagine-rich protein [Babesia caballi]|uniref:Asparagine-rich protein n=1 Tax=Babesia caballi TaxID=5871 RepID=A0AAV4LMJ6_BABCB|nr:asparagine-rich protein [Babesia caballi]